MESLNRGVHPMALWNCKKCGVVMKESNTLSIAEIEDAENDDEDGEIYYVGQGVCPGCGGRGIPVERIDT
jgi:hypothetical protein